MPAIQAKGWGKFKFASLQSFKAFFGGFAYDYAKGDVAQMTRAMAQAWTALGINFNAIEPGFFRIELKSTVFADPYRSVLNAQSSCIGRNGELEDIDGRFLFLASWASDYVIGSVLMVGGVTVKLRHWFI